MSLGLMLADLLGWSQAEKGAAARKVLDRRRVHAMERGEGGKIGVYLCGPDGRLWVYLDREEFAVLADYACTTGHPDADRIALANQSAEGDQ